MAGIFGKVIKKLFLNPLARAIDVEDPAYIQTHHRILMSNPFLKTCYERWYREASQAADAAASIPGQVVELGCGVGFLEQYVSDLVKTDSVPNPYASQVVDAMNLAFPPESLKAIFLIQVFHHLKSPENFLKNAERCLKPGGRLVLVEPHNTFSQKILCRFLDHYEYLDPTVPEWETPDAGTMRRANLAMAWIVFIRDAHLFQKKFPKLRIRRIRYHTFLAYIISGGMTYRPFMPASLLPLLNVFEWLMAPFGKWFATSMTVEIEKLA